MKLRHFENKTDARNYVWDLLESSRVARFPFPVRGRIPNFAGAEAAAARLFDEPPWRDARAIKVNPDSPQRPVRRMALERGVRVYVPTPRLAGGFHLLDPERIDPTAYDEAATLATMTRHSVPVALDELPQFDAIVTGCAAVTPAGKRCGKGAGYSDIEYALLRELGHAAAPVATTVHDIQIVGDFPVESNDLPLSVICTPTQTLRVAQPLAAPAGIEWQRLTSADIERMPVLAELRALAKATL